MARHTPTPGDLPLSEDETVGARVIRPTNPYMAFTKAEIEQSLPERFEQQVAQYPDCVAVQTRHDQLTYDELNRWANRIARTILAQCGDSEEPIAVLFGLGAPLFAAIIGSLKAGKIVVPLDPAFPYNRLSGMLEHSQASLTLTNHQYAPAVHQLNQHGHQILNIDELDSSLSDENIGLPLAPDRLAHIIYTSGSTGEPKGVVQNHRNALHNTMVLTNSYHVCAEDRLALLYSSSGSGTIRIIFLGLLNGAALHPFDIQEQGLAHLADWLMQEKITVYSSIVSVFRYFVNTLTGAEAFPKLRLIHIGGEPARRRDVELYKEHFSPHCLFVNRYGATEATNVLMYFLDMTSPLSGSVVPIGYPVEDINLRLLDENGQDVGMSGIGEITIQGRYIALGYWQRPDLTRAKFLSDPDGGDERMYLTGDLGRRLPDGSLLHLGRKDMQVQIRGNRVEVTEVEMALLDLETVKEAVVLAQPDTSGEPRLVAYIASAVEPPPTVSALRRALEQTLTSYLLPSVFIMLDALPLAPTGKLDRQALPLPSRTRPTLDTPFVSACTPVEQELVKIWSEVLSLDQVGIRDPFLELGGHSLLATQVISRIRQAFEVELPLRSLFNRPTVADIAEYVETIRWATLSQSSSSCHPLDDREEGAL